MLQYALKHGIINVWKEKKGKFLRNYAK
jgi:hypothetical protein